MHSTKASPVYFDFMPFFWNEYIRRIFLLQNKKKRWISDFENKFRRKILPQLECQSNNNLKKKKTIINTYTTTMIFNEFLLFSLTSFNSQLFKWNDIIFFEWLLMPLLLEPNELCPIWIRIYFVFVKHCKIYNRIEKFFAHTHHIFIHIDIFDIFKITN